MSILAVLAPLASACAVFFGKHGAVADAARRRATSRQTLYREADRVVQAVEGSAAREQVEALQAACAALQQRVADLEARLARAVEITDDRLGHFAATAQAEGVSLPVGRRLLAIFLDALTPSVATLGRRNLRRGKGQRTKAAPHLDEEDGLSV